MTPFTLAGYASLLEAAIAGGYRFSPFADDGGEAGRLFLRHDVDKCPFAAFRMAELEHGLGVRAHYFFLLRTPLYNLLEPAVSDAVRAIAAMGHWVGLHCDARRMREALREPEAPLDQLIAHEIGTFARVVGVDVTRSMSFHNPDREVVGRAPTSDAYVSAYDPRFMMPITKYLSDSNARWREGDPRDGLAQAAWPRLQLLVHPIWWASEAPQAPLDRLSQVFTRRVEQLQVYMNYTNDLWRETRMRPALTVERPEALG